MPPASLSNPREERPGTVGCPPLDAIRNLQNPPNKPDLVEGGVSGPDESQLHVHLAQIVGSPLAHFVSTLRSHLRSPVLPPSLSGIWLGSQ